jgi:hypothetical protein
VEEPEIFSWALCWDPFFSFAPVSAFGLTRKELQLTQEDLFWRMVFANQLMLLIKLRL